jgi:hypothetical protein
MNRYIARDLWEICWPIQLRNWQRPWRVIWKSEVNREFRKTIKTIKGTIWIGFVSSLFAYPINYRNLSNLSRNRNSLRITNYNLITNQFTFLSQIVPDRYCYSIGGLHD